MNGLSEEIEELRTQKTMLLSNMNCCDGKEVGRVRTRISNIEKGMEIMRKHQKEMPERNPTPSHRKHEDEWDLEL